jgi:MFS family permease
MAVWFWAMFVLFLTRGLLVSTWSTQGPAIKDALSFDLPAMGWYAASLALGSIMGILSAEHLVGRFGSRVISILSYSILGSGLVLLGLNLFWEISPLAFVVTFLIGVPLGIADFDNNLEASTINRLSAKNRVPLLHGGYSLGVLMGAALVGVALSVGMSVSTDFLIIGLIVLGVSVFASTFIGKDNGKLLQELENSAPVAKISLSEVFKEPRTRHVTLIGIAFVFSETTGVVWLPIALVQQGYSPALAAWGYTVFGTGFVLMRFVGGPIADAIGRQRVILYSSIAATVGILMFIGSTSLVLSLIGALLWGLGNSIGVAMCVAALGDDPARVNTRMTFFWIFAYSANLIVGPLLGALSNLGGLMLTFAVPIVLFILAALVSKAVSEEHPESLTAKVAKF